MKLLKFRALTDDNFDKVCEIIEKDEFWCSKLWNMNDPMEGIYRNRFLSQEIFDAKNSRIICSFSDHLALSNPLLWGNYANGFRGIAIEIEVEKKNFYKIEYKNIHEYEKKLDNVIKIMTRKLVDWSYEMEWRYIISSTEEKAVEIGNISKVYFGTPYYNINNRKNVEENSQSLRKYNFLKHELELKCREKGIRTQDFNWHESGYRLWQREHFRVMNQIF